MTRVWSIAVLLAAFVVAALAPAATAAATPSAPRTFLVIAGGLAWTDVTPTSTPTLWNIASRGAVGDLNAVLRARESGELPSALEGALDLSAGNWVAPEFYALGAYNATESVDGTSAAVAYERRMGSGVGDDAIAYVGLPPEVRKATNLADDVVVGSLGQAVEDTGGACIAIGNSDASDPVLKYKVERPAALAAMDQLGLVRFGDVSRDLLTDSALAPGGVRTDLRAFEGALTSAESSAAAHGGPTLVVLDPGDSYRSQRFAWQATDTVATTMREAAARELDDVVAMALRHAGPDDLVLVAGQAAPVEPSAGVAGFSPLFAWGGGLHGYLTSGSTHREGVVSNPDVTASLLHALRLERPVQVIGTPISAVPAPDSAAERIDHLSRLNTTAVAQNAVRGSFSSFYDWLFVLVVLAGTAFVALRDRIVPGWRDRAATAAKVVCLAAACLPIGGWVLYILTPTIASPAEQWLSLFAAAALLLVVALLVWRFAGERWALPSVLLFSVVVLVVDQLLGAPLSRTNLLGYSPLDSARYYGIGNEAAGLLVGSTLAGLALVFDGSGREDAGKWVRGAIIAVVSAVVVFVCAAPFFGANVGVAVWGSVGFIVAWTLMTGRRITLKIVLIAGLVVLLSIGAFAIIDLFGGGPQTHLARSVTSTEQGGLSQLSVIVQRKAETNARILNRSNWSTLLVVTMSFLVALRFLPGRPLTRLLARYPAFASALWAGVAAGVLAFLTEDTGIDVPSWIWLPLGIAAVWLALRLASGEQAER